MPLSTPRRNRTTIPEPDARERIRQLFVANIGRVVTSAQLRDAAGCGVGEWARLVRELREYENWPILNHDDGHDLKRGQYLLEIAPPEKSVVKFSRSISARLRDQFLDRTWFTCEMCGISPGEIDEDTGRKVRFRVGLVVDKSLGGRDELTNLRALCSRCNQGVKSITTEKPTAIWLLSQIRRGGNEEQLVVLNWLHKKFRRLKNRNSAA